MRPDFSIDNVVAVEVKNYDIENNSAALIKAVADQALQRGEHLPAGMKQRVTIDIRGQRISESRREEIVESIVLKAKGSLEPTSIRFKEDD